ncbi:ParA family protein [Hymenobacter cavernae]|uniref:Sporulation initiation inhibitor Soj n=1 Tax=Hymenobacter cavernae TaxID=2044852 RepID=A0ABQ1UXY2_9BACT|nr:ParA family protein [Hymenobacter cavernae]GGF27984.1 sporulation initiation inhibitor Soj [Hymenobacter cavernae]
MEVFTFALRKGGTGKTTSVWAVGNCLAQSGYRVLMVDADAQANLTRCLPPVDYSQNLTLVVDGKATLPDVMKPVGNNLWLVAATESLVVAEKVLGADLAYPLLLKKAIKGLAKHIDYVLIDSPPSPNSPLTIAALTASTKVFVPAQPEVFSFDGVQSLLELTEKIQDSYNPELAVGGIFLTKYSPSYRRSLHHAFVKKMREKFGNLVMETSIRDNVAIAEAQVQRQSLYQAAPQSNALVDYEALTREIIARS